MRMMQTMLDRRRGESAFTIVEVLVGALIITVVFAGAMYFVAGAGKSQSKSLVRQRMSAVADDVSARVRADATWLKVKPECKTTECNLSDQFPQQQAKPSDPKLIVTVMVKPIDSKGDGVAPNDEDNITPDYYRVTVRVELAPGQEAQFGSFQPYEMVSTIDATAIGRAAGSLVVQTCEAVNQVDERMSIASCQGGAGNRRDMNQQPEPCKSPFPLSWNEWLNMRPVLPLGCNNAFNSAKSKDSFLTAVQTRGVTNVGFTIRRDASDGGPAITRSQADASQAADGTYEFAGLPAGTYFLTASPGQGRELWATKTIPSAMKASVQANQEARALIMVRPKQGLGTYSAKFTRATWHYRLTSYTDKDVYEEPGPAGSTIRTTTTYVYLVSNPPVRKVWNGPAWNGILSMESKPFDRYHDSNNIISQPTILVGWAPQDDPTGVKVMGPLATGLHSLPAQQPAPVPAPSDFFGSFGSRTQSCFAGITPGGQCGNFAWIDYGRQTNGRPDSTVQFHSEDGECYIESSVPGYQIARRLQNGGDHAQRCDRDLIYVNPQTGERSVVKNFLPDKQGNGGGQLVLSMSQVTECINCPLPTPPAVGASSSPSPSTSGPNQSVSPVGGKASTPPSSPPRIVVRQPAPAPTPSNPRPNPPAAVSLPAAAAVPMANGK